MYPYFLMIGLPALLGLAATRRFQAGAGLALVFVTFMLVIGLRYEIGPDWFAYAIHVQRYPTLDFAELAARGEVGWSLTVIAADALGLGMQGVVFFSGLVFCVGVFAVARSCQEPMLAIVAAVPYLSIAVAMSGLRQATAIGIIFVLVAHWYRWSIPVKIGVVLLASTFHFSALAMLLVVALDSRLTLFQRIAAGGIIAGIVGYLVAVTEVRVDRYSDKYLPGGSAADTPGALYHVLLTAVPALVYFFLRRRWIEVYGRIAVIDLFAAIGAIALIFVFFFPNATDRMTLYFSVVALIVQANLPNLWPGKPEQSAIRFGIIALNVIAMLTFLIAGNKAGSFVPYMSVFSEEAQLGISRR